LLLLTPSKLLLSLAAFVLVWAGAGDSLLLLVWSEAKVPMRVR
jgi:hypothetical protein